MHHEYLDKYSRLSSPVHRLDARVKLIAVFAVICIVTFSYSAQLALSAIIFAFALFAISGIPFAYIISRLGICLPFLVFIIFVPAEQAILLLLKSAASILLVILLMSTTTFPSFLSALRFIRVPNLFILMLSFFYRYIFLFIENIHKMRKAAGARSAGVRNPLSPSDASGMLGSMFIRSFEQSERVYAAMRARCYDDKDK